jgi:hypothetical protein
VDAFSVWHPNLLNLFIIYSNAKPFGADALLDKIKKELILMLRCCASPALAVMFFETCVHWSQICIIFVQSSGGIPDVND